MTSPRKGASLALLLALLGIGFLGRLEAGRAPTPETLKNSFCAEAVGDIPTTGLFCFEKVPIRVSSLLSKAGADPEFWLGTSASGDCIIEPGTRIVFQTIGGKPLIRTMPMNSFSRMTLGLKIPINQVSAEELTAMPGIGPALASDIIEYRDVLGGFDHISQILDVGGIGRQTLEKMRPHLLLP